MGLVELSNLTPIITTADAKAHLRVDTDDENDYVAALTLAATDWLEKQTNLTLTPRHFRLTLDAWPTEGTILIPRPPLVTIDAITIGGQTLDPSRYTTDATTTPGRVIIAVPPEGGVVITFSAGYTTPPPALAHAAKLLVGAWFLNREAAQDRTISGLPAAVALDTIVNSYRIPFAGGFEV